jgi:hypothetical protein
VMIFLRNVRSCILFSNRSPTASMWHSIWSVVSCLGTNFTLTCLSFKLSDRIAWMDPWETPASCYNSAMVILRLGRISCRTFSIIRFWMSKASRCTGHPPASPIHS